MTLQALSIGDLTIKYPIIQGGMGVGISRSRLAGAVSANGGLGIISTAQIGYDEPDFDQNQKEANMRAIEKHLAKAKEISGGRPVGVNIMVATKDYPDYVKKSVEAGADVVISGAGLPVRLPEYVAGSNCKIAPIVSSEKAAMLMLRNWEKKYGRTADFIVIEGPKAGGHLGFKVDQIGTLTDAEYDEEIKKIIAVVRQYEEKFNQPIPVIVAGGIFDHNDICHAISLGASGVQIASRFVATQECDADERYKQAYLDAKREDVEIVMSPVGMPGRALKNEFVKIIEEKPLPVTKCFHCLEKCNPAKVPYCITKALINAVRGDTEHGLIFVGEIVGRIKKIVTVHDLMEELVTG
ncbi:MAG: nitronate monooxygenase family protein [Clostridiaceae bacterium]|nr:nitronate monooxygenase family protein [Clostridiaceae bacterium]